MDVRSALTLACAWHFALAGCSKGPDGGDAAASDATGDAGSGVTSPDISWLADGAPPIAPPVLTPCPAGWREVAPAAERDPSTCDPYPEGGELACAAGEAHFAGEAGCGPVGSACPAGEFSDTLPTDSAVVYVRPGATAGDGTEARPYGRLTEFAFGGLATGTVIALSRGSHDGPVRLARGIRLWGACAAGTTLTASAPSSDGVVTVVSATGEVHDLTVASSPRPGVSVTEGADVSLEGVVVDDVEDAAVLVGFDARLSARGLAVRGTRGRSSDGAFGHGLVAQEGAMADLSRTLFATNRELGVFATDSGTAVTLSDAAVADTGGRGLGVQAGATVDVTRGLFHRNRDVGVFVGDTGTAVTLSETVIRDTRPLTSGGITGRGMNVQFEATAQATRVLLDTNHDVAVFASEPGTMVTLSDAVVRDTESQISDGTAGRALDVQVGASASVTRALFERNREVAVYASDANTTVTLSDTTVRDTRGQTADDTGGRGLGVQRGATAEVTRALLEASHEVAMHAGGVGTALTLSDAVVRDTQSQGSDASLGRGLNVQFGATADVTRVLFERNRDMGVFASEPGTVLTLSDAVVRDTDGRSSDELFGRGLDVQAGAVASLTRALLEANREVGAYAHGAGTEATLTDVEVRDTRARACADTSCSDSPAGHGIGSYVEATLSMTRFVVSSPFLCGAHLANDAQMDLSDGEVRQSPIGVCLQVDGYDIARLMDDVRYVDNGENLQATDLPVPDPAGAAAASP